LQSLLPEQRKKDTVVVALSPDTLEDIVKIIPKVQAKTNQDFAVTLLSDAEHKVIDRYGLLNEKAAQRGRNIPHPTTYVIDKTQTIRWRFTEVDYKIRPTNEMILAEIGKIK
jgi:peroxiredoxin